MLRIKRRLTPAALLLTIICQGQDAEVAVLTGKILSATTGEAIPFATISYSANGINTVSNEEGNFIFKIPASGKGDSLYLSHIGYATLAIPVNRADTGLRIIRLREQAVQLPDVTVKPIDPMDLLHKAFDRIPDNYPTTPYLSNGFYRMTGVHNNKIIDVSEAVFEISSPDNERQHKEFRLIKARADQEHTAFNGTNFAIGRRPERLMDFDMVSRINGTQILGEQGQKDHQFLFRGMTEYGGQPAYEIDFDQKEGVTKSLYKGKIFIDAESLAFLCFDYQVSPKGLPYRDPHVSGGLTNTLLFDSIVVSYLKYGGKYYLNHVYTLLKQHVHYDGKNAFDYDPLITTTNYLVTRIDTGQAALARNGRTIGGKTLIEGQAGRRSRNTDPDFWENYNLIEAGFNVDSAVNVIRKNNKEH